MATVALCALRITFSAFASLTSLVTATSVLCASRNTFSSPSLLLHPHLRCRHLLELYGDILLVRPEEYIVGYHYIVPVRCEEYIFDIPFSASPSTFCRLHLLEPHVNYVHWLRWWHRTCALRGVHRRHPLHAYLCISTPPSYIYAATIYWSTCTWSVSSSPSTGAPCHSRTVAIEIVTAEEF